MRIPGLDVPVCPTCRQRQWDWLTSRPQDIYPGLGYVTQASAAYSFTPAGARDNRRARHEQWRTLVRQQVAGIAEDCQRQHLTPADASPPEPQPPDPASPLG